MRVVDALRDPSASVRACDSIESLVASGERQVLSSLFAAAVERRLLVDVVGPAVVTLSPPAADDLARAGAALSALRAVADARSATDPPPPLHEADVLAALTAAVSTADHPTDGGGTATTTADGTDTDDTNVNVRLVASVREAALLVVARWLESASDPQPLYPILLQYVVPAILDPAGRTDAEAAAEALSIAAEADPQLPVPIPSLVARCTDPSTGPRTCALLAGTLLSLGAGVDDTVPATLRRILVNADPFGSAAALLDAVRDPACISLVRQWRDAANAVHAALTVLANWFTTRPAAAAPDLVLIAARLAAGPADRSVVEALGAGARGVRTAAALAPLRAAAASAAWNALLAPQAPVPQDLATAVWQAVVRAPSWGPHVRVAWAVAVRASVDAPLADAHHLLACAAEHGTTDPPDPDLALDAAAVGAAGRVAAAAGPAGVAVSQALAAAAQRPATAVEAALALIDVFSVDPEPAVDAAAQACGVCDLVATVATATAAAVVPPLPDVSVAAARRDELLAAAEPFVQWFHSVRG